MLKNPNFVQKSEISSNITILFKNLNLVEKLQFCSKIENLFKNKNFGQPKNELQKMGLV